MHLDESSLLFLLQPQRIMMQDLSIEREVRKALSSHGRLSIGIDSLDSSADLHDAGLTSLATVNVMLALEGSFDLEFPDALLTRSTFRSVDSIREALSTLGAG